MNERDRAAMNRKLDNLVRKEHWVISRENASYYAKSWDDACTYKDQQHAEEMAKAVEIIKWQADHLDYFLEQFPGEFDKYQRGGFRQVTAFLSKMEERG